MAPLFSQELRSLRGTLSVSKMAELCNVSRETVRRIESGKLLPSNSVLRVWLAVADEDLQNRPDIVVNIISERNKRNVYVRETEELRNLVSSSTTKRVEHLTKQLMLLLSECELLPKDSEDWMYMRIHNVLEEHITETL